MRAKLSRDSIFSLNVHHNLMCTTTHTVMKIYNVILSYAYRLFNLWETHPQTAFSPLTLPS